MVSFPTQWNYLKAAKANKRLSQSMLFVGAMQHELKDFVVQLMQMILCREAKEEPCLHCIDCKMIQENEHPDMEWVKPEKSAGAIKIDQIREMQSSVFLTPQKSTYRLIAIEGADRMNSASANALLKILEEPPLHTLFFLMTQQIGTVPPTVLSRCQIISCSSSHEYSANFLTLGEQYPADSRQALMIKQSEMLLDSLIALIERKEHPCTLAARWSEFDLDVFLWFLYLVYSQLQQMYWLESEVSGIGADRLLRLKKLLDPVLIFTQIDKINHFLKKLGHNLSMNQSLVLEELFFSLLKA